MKKRILALLLSLSLMVSVVVPGTVAMDGGDTVDDTYTELAVNDRKTLHASQFGISAEPYQWQISIGGTWINISGETSDSITVSYAMLCNALSGDTAQVRCVGYNSDGTPIEPEAMTIRITEEVAPTPVEQEETHPAGTVLEQAKPLGDPIIEKIEGESEDIKDQIKEKIDKFKDNAKDALDQIKDSAKEKLEELKNKIDEKNDPEPIDQTEETSAETTVPAETTAEPASTDDSAATDDSVVTGGSESTNIETDTAPTTDEDAGDDDVSDQTEMTETTGEAEQTGNAGEAEPENPADSEDKTSAAEEPADTTTEQEVTTSAPETEAPVTEAPETDAPVATEPSEGSDEDQTEDIVISAPSFASPLTDEEPSAENKENDTQTPPPAPAEQTPPTSPSDPVTPAAPEKQEEQTGNTENTDEDQKASENTERKDVPSDEQNNVPTVTDSANAVPASDPATADNEEPNKDGENVQENDTPAGETTSTYTIIIKYQFENDAPAANPWSATVATGSSYAQVIQSPVVVGYKPDQETVQVNATEATTYTVTYKPAEVEFTVKHYQQNVSNDQYTLVDTETKTGYTENAVGDGLAKTEYTGFYSLLYDTTTKIAADGSTVVEIYYDRYYYLMHFDLDGGHGVEPIYARYGTKIDVDETALKKPGYTFDKWEGEKQIPETMPAVNVSFKAIWKVAEKAKVTVVVWGENPDDEDYSYIKSSEIQVKPGTTLTKDDLTHVLTCSEEEHDHAAAGCTLACNHVHDLTCYGLSANAQSSNPNDKTAFWCKSNPETYFAQLGIEDGYLYYDDENAELASKDNYYLRLNGAYYILSKTQFNKLKDDLVGSTSDNTLHNPDYYYKYKIKASGINCTHTHTDSCYTCGKAAHKHNANCYTSPLDMDGTLWKLVKCDEVTVAADGTSKLNVYYDRVEFTLHFRMAYSNNDDYGTIQKKWGANIRTDFQAKSDSAGTSSWSLDRDASSPWTSYLDVMPTENRTYYAYKTSGESSAYYYVEDLDGKDKLFYTSTASGTDLLVSKEEFIEISGFTFNPERSSKVNENFDGARFYYTRNSYNLNFHNHNTELTDKVTSVKFEAPLKGHDFKPEYPSDLKPNAYDFAGWYTTSGCFDGSEMNWNTMTMPASDVILYAKWTPKTHTVKTYLTKEEMESGESGKELNTYDKVTNGTAVTNPPADPKNGSYTFVGWFYTSDTGEEKAFDFSMPVNRDLNLYAKWRSDKLMEYTIKYELEGGTVIAPPTTGSALAGTTKTFNAKTGTQLNEGYQSGYFPKVSSHSITIDIADASKNKYTFVYVAKDEVEYTVRYLDKTTGEPVVVDGVSTPDKVVKTRDAVVTETFKQITGYAPDAYQKQLVLAAEGNEIIFWYTKDNDHAPVQIIHWTQNIVGDGYTEYQSSTNLNGVIETEYSETPLTIAGFTYNGMKSKASGELTASGLVLNLYYDRIEYPYEFRFVEKDSNTEKQLENSVADTARYQAQVTQTAKTIPGYTLVSAENQSINIAIEDGTTAVKNVKTFYYTEQMVDIRYQVVGPDGCGKVDIYQEAQLKVFTGKPKGSTPTANEGFKFVGWFKDEACTQAVDETWIAAENKLTPQKTKDLGNNVMGYEAATYYAKFEYNLTSLTITKNGWESIDEHQSFIFKVTGEGLPNDGLKVTITPSVNDSVTITGLTVGKEYTVTEESGWSWRYSAGTGSKILEADATQNVITINNDRNKNQWLNGCAYAPNKFGSPITNN